MVSSSSRDVPLHVLNVTVLCYIHNFLLLSFYNCFPVESLCVPLVFLLLLILELEPLEMSISDFYEPFVSVVYLYLRGKCHIML